MTKMRIVTLWFGMGRQKRVLERWTNPKVSRRTCTCEYVLQSHRGNSAGVAKRPRERSSTRNPTLRFATLSLVAAGECVRGAAGAVHAGGVRARAARDGARAVPAPQRQAAAGGGCHPRGTAMQKWRIVILRFGTARQKMVLERWTNPKPLQPIWDRAAI
jgi:hypothetical protein